MPATIFDWTYKRIRGKSIFSDEEFKKQSTMSDFSKKLRRDMDYLIDTNEVSDYLEQIHGSFRLK